ncbi:MAG: nucleotidyltransferase family protein [Acidimicrobiales bacterium]
MTSSPEAKRLVATVAAWRTATTLQPPTEALDEPTWGRLFSDVTVERLGGLLAWAIAADEWPATDDQRQQAYESHRSWMASALRLETELLEVADLLDQVDAPFQVLKGTAVAHLDYPDPSLRCFGDVDLLVPGTAIERARDALLARGGTRAYNEPRPGFDRRFTKGLAITTPHGVEIDVHRTLSAGPFGLALDLDGLHAHPDHFTVGGRRLAALGRPQRFLHACFHAVLGSAEPRLVPLRDLVQTAPATAVEVEAVRHLAERSRATAVVARAVHATQAKLGWQPPLVLRAWTDAYRETTRDRRWLAGYVGEQRAYATQAVTAVEAVPGGPATKAAYLWAVAFPVDASRGDARRARWQRGARALRARLATQR